MEKESFIQVGVTALRSPMGDFLPAVPLYIKSDQLKQSKLTQSEENLLRDVSGVFVDKYKQYTSKDKEVQNVKV